MCGGAFLLLPFLEHLLHHRRAFKKVIRFPFLEMMVRDDPVLIVLHHFSAVIRGVH